MERISIFNYEAFYLDFLEGNLNEEDTALLMAFLEENPDLRIDDAELPSYDEDSLTLNPDFKNSLKQPDLSGAISNDNVEHFMIANTEGLLEESKTEELEAFVSQNPVLAKENRIYNAVHLEPDLNVTYQDKESLKHKTIVLWPYVASIAAVLLLALLFIWSALDGPVRDSLNNVVAEETNEKSKSLSIEEALNDNSSINVADVVNENSVDNDMASNTINSRPNNQGGQDKNEQDPVGTMERIPVGNVLTALNNKQLEPISSPTFRPDNEQSANNDSQVLASVSLTGEMENPIEPITNFIAKKTRTDIDFKRTKKDADPKDGKGFFIKIGKFELSRKKH